MRTATRQYLQAVRAESAYPIFRGVIGTVALLLYLMAGATALMALAGAVGLYSTSALAALAALVAGGAAAAIVALLARMWKEAALMLADLADSTVDAHSRAQV